MHLVSLLAALPFLFFLGTSTTLPMPMVQPAAEVYFMPHQDDEMFMAGSIKHAVDLGKQVYVVLVTDGSHSSARSLLNGHNDAGKPVYSAIDHRYLDPQKEGYQYISEEQFANLRREEFNASVHALGVPYNHIYAAQSGSVNEFLNKSYTDGQLTVAEAADVVSHFHHLFGDNTIYNTLTSSKKKGQHPDHHALSLALVRDQTIKLKRFFSEDTTFGTPIELTPAEQQAKYEALGNYYIWDPKQGRFAIGEHSVKPLLDFWRNNKEEYYTVDYAQVNY